MKRQNKGRWRERWIVILRLRVVKRWKGKGMKKVEESVIIKIKKKKSKRKKKNYRKIEKKNDNDVNADMTQLKRGNNKCYTSAFRYI